MTDAEQRLWVLAEEFEKRARELRKLESSVSRLEAALTVSVGEGDVKARDAIHTWLAATTTEIVDRVQAVGSNAAEHAVILKALEEPGRVLISADALRPVRDALDAFAESATQVEDALADACNRLEAAVSELIETGDELVEDVVGRVDHFVDRARDISTQLNSQIGETLEKLVPGDLQDAFTTFDDFADEAERTLGTLESTLETGLGGAVEFVGKVVELVEPVLPLLEQVEELA